MCLADCDIVWGKLSQGAGFCSPQHHWAVAQLLGLQPALLSKLEWARAGSGSGIAKVHTAKSSSVLVQSTSATLVQVLALGKNRELSNVNTSAIRVSLCMHVFLCVPKQKPHRYICSLDQKPLGRITPVIVVLYFLSPRYLFTFTVLKNKVGGKRHHRTKIVWAAHKGKVAGSQGEKKNDIKTAMQDGLFSIFGGVYLRKT